MCAGASAKILTLYIPSSFPLSSRYSTVRIQRCIAVLCRTFRGCKNMIFAYICVWSYAMLQRGFRVDIYAIPLQSVIKGTMDMLDMVLRPMT